MKRRVPTYKDLFGKWLVVAHALDDGLVGLSGVLHNETAKTVVLSTARGPKTLLKTSLMSMNVCERENERCKKLYAWELAGRPHDRLKRKYWKRGRSFA
ncbi:MAG: hypothetical protein QXU97_01945 [Fervidicoccaceae archaeon]